jgi:hypothetical protein
MLRFGGVSLVRTLFRDRRSVVAGVLVASLVTAMLGPSLHVDDGHDSDADAPVIVHDASQHRVTPDTQGETPATEQHCLACHVVRLVRDDAVETLWFAPVVVDATRRVDRTRHVVGPIAGPPLPARAPPASLFA